MQIPSQKTGTSDETVVLARLLIPGRGDPIQNAAVAVSTTSGKITFVGPQCNLPQRLCSAPQIRVACLLPGLWDCHTHFAGITKVDFPDMIQTHPAICGAAIARGFYDTLMAGVTSVRDVGSFAIEAHVAVKAGLLLGPSVFGAGGCKGITGGSSDATTLPLDFVYATQGVHHTKPWPGTSCLVLADGPDECRRAVRQQIRRGALCIKVITTGGVMSTTDNPEYRQYSDAELDAIMDEAKLQHRAVAAHAHGTAGIIAAIKAGATTIEHGSYLTEEVTELMKSRGTTLVATRHIVEAGLRMLDKLPAPTAAKMVAVANRHLESYKLAVQSGVKIALGTDICSSNPTEEISHGKNAIELVWAVTKAGMTPLAAIEAATANAAETLGPQAPKKGILQVGWDADMIAMDENPLERIQLFSDPQNVKFVWKEGKMVKSPSDSFWPPPLEELCGWNIVDRCDLQRPSCQRCIAGKSTCIYAPTVLEFRDSTAWAAQKVATAKARSRASHAMADTDPNAATSSNADCHPNPASSLVAFSGATASPPTSRITPTNVSIPSGDPYSVSPEEIIGSEVNTMNWDGETDLTDAMWMIDCIGSASRRIEAPLEGSNPTARNSDPVYSESLQQFDLDQEAQGDNHGFSGAERSPRLSPSQLGNAGDSGNTKDAISIFSPGQNLLMLEFGRPGARHTDQIDYISSWPALPESPPRSLHITPDVPVGDRLYLAHFTTHVANLLPTEMRTLRTRALTETHVQLAAMAHSAAHLAFLQGAHKTDQYHVSRWVSKESHRKRGSELTALAWRAIELNSELSLETRLTVMLLLCYRELEAGTIYGLWDLVSRLDRRILASLNKLTSLGHGIMQGWSHIRALSKRTWPLVQPTTLESRVEKILSQLEEDYAMSRRVDSICVMAIRLIYRAISCKCLGHSSSPSIGGLQNIGNWWKIIQGSVELPVFEGDYENSLNEDQLYTELQCLGARLQDCEVPREFPSDFEATLHLSTAEDLSPGPTDVGMSSPVFRFSTHDQAMSCADYAFAHITTDDRLLEYAIAPAGDKSTPRPPNPWLALLKHIAQELDLADCANRNAYRMSIITQILCGALLCSEPNALDFLDSFIHRMLARGVWREDALTPLLLFSRVINTLQKEFLEGRQVFLCSVTLNEFTAKEKLMTSIDGQCLIIFGREASGMLFSDCVPLL
ncbi:hypothetical protein E8E14_008818 [Neopestalotiopsis sp. 37M]|nr:hypothetical protein E8E14_008818 [Neopestalotiopsis sp. 37M]